MKKCCIVCLTLLLCLSLSSCALWNDRESILDDFFSFGAEAEKPATSSTKKSTKKTTKKTTEKTEEKHVHDYEKTVVEPTCLEGGYTLNECACGDSYKGEYKTAVGHKYVVIKDRAAKAATCLKDGVQVLKCERCSEKKTSPLSALGHDMDDGVCTRCSYSIRTAYASLANYLLDCGQPDGDTYVSSNTLDDGEGGEVEIRLIYVEDEDALRFAFAHETDDIVVLLELQCPQPDDEIADFTLDIETDSREIACTGSIVKSVFSEENNAISAFTCDDPEMKSASESLAKRALTILLESFAALEVELEHGVTMKDLGFKNF